MVTALFRVTISQSWSNKLVFFNILPNPGSINQQAQAPRTNSTPFRVNQSYTPSRHHPRLSSSFATSKPAAFQTLITRLRTKHHAIEMAPPPSKPASLTPDMEVFVRQLAANGEDARSITLLLETEYPVLLGQKGVFEWVKGSMGR
ncbi:MAG: hypothetical protein FRX48_03486 [Lasallia pustulata]|uniref:Uncharacterized protein n=1 Tax=Lasallia pustulata TaxID=136370 RepID=A0A5M8PU01_9LECA|nr:MAG: hypothetical protein FRX48_03486 [Lasallia pustulata]